MINYVKGYREKPKIKTEAGPLGSALRRLCSLGQSGCVSCCRGSRITGRWKTKEEGENEDVLAVFQRDWKPWKENRADSQQGPRRTGKELTFHDEHSPTEENRNKYNK